MLLKSQQTNKLTKTKQQQQQQQQQQQKQEQQRQQHSYVYLEKRFQFLVLEFTICFILSRFILLACLKFVQG